MSVELKSGQHKMEGTQKEMLEKEENKLFLLTSSLCLLCLRKFYHSRRMMLTIRKKKNSPFKCNLTDKWLLKIPETSNSPYRALKHAKHRQTGNLALGGIKEVSFAATSHLWSCWKCWRASMSCAAEQRTCGNTDPQSTFPGAPCALSCSTAHKLADGKWHWKRTAM